MLSTKWLRLCLVLVFATLACRPASAQTYDSFAVGKLSGKLVVQWIEPDKFIFLPDKDVPLTFVRSNGDKIVPGRMITDGGSIPRPLWILRSYSPWGYAPAFIIHDWLFAMKQCRIDGYERYDHEKAATILAEVMKTMMEMKKVETDKLTLISMFTAVNSYIAEDLWNNSPCLPVPAGPREQKPIAEFELSFE
jgi:Protein of unknown function (DUF1353)